MLSQQDINKTVFNSADDIDTLFKTQNATSFIDWFNQRVGQGALSRTNGFEALPTITNRAGWVSVWNNIEVIWGRPIDIYEFLTIDIIISTETGSKFVAVNEISGLKSKGYPGISYAFSDVVGVKASYNLNNSLGNKTAYTLFNNPDFIAEHGHKPFGTLLKDTTDVRWKTDQYPFGFDNNSPRETDTRQGVNTFIQEADFYKFRGRGFIQTTGRANYKQIVNYILNYTGSNSVILDYQSQWEQYNGNLDLICTISSNNDWDSLFKTTNGEVASEAINIHNKSGPDYLTISTKLSESDLTKKIRFAGKRVNGGDSYADTVLARVKFLLNELNSTPNNNSTTPPVTTANVPDDGSQNVGSGSNPKQTGQDNPNLKTPAEVGGITNFFKPNIQVDRIEINTEGSGKTKQELASALGFVPVIWYNGTQIEAHYIISMSLISVETLPTLKLTFIDQLGIMEDLGFPLDDTIIKVFITSRTTILRPILMDFKVTNFAKISDNSYSLSGVASINRMFINKFESYGNNTSFAVLQEVAKRCSLGFNSNITDTADQMPWINPNLLTKEFINYVIDYSYKSDNTFLWGFVDFYYNLNYIDVETELNRNIDSQSAVSTTGYQNVRGYAPAEDSVNLLYLSNDDALEASNLFFESWQVINNSTQISLDKGYLNITSYYDTLNLKFSQYNIDAITSDPTKNITLKGAPNDLSFYAENTRNTWNGKIDLDNMHANFGYAATQNKINLKEMEKIGLILVMRLPNFNLYRFQKVRVFITYTDQTATRNIKNERLSGDWLIIGIKLKYTEGKLRQELRLMRRELSLNADEVAQISNNQASNSRQSTGSSVPTNNQINANPGVDSNGNIVTQ